MTSSDSIELFRPKSKHAVNRLLELAQNKIVAQEHWHTPINPENEKSKKEKSKPEHKNIRARQNVDTRQKGAQKERLKELVDQTINQQDLFKPVPQNKQEVEKKYERFDITLKFIRNAKLRPFNSNMTFYSLKKQAKPKFVNSSLSFYKSKPKDEGISSSNKNTGIFSSKDMKKYKQTGQFEKQQISKSVVYFTSNKAETVRQLLNRMSAQRTRSSQVLLNSTVRQVRQEENYQSAYQQNYLSQQQLKLINRYSKFVPFQKDEQLLFRKISEVDSIWLSKFRQSWQRSKQNRDSRGRYLKKLIVK